MKAFVCFIVVMGVLNTLCYIGNMADGGEPLPAWGRHLDAAYFAVLAIWGAYLLGQQS